MLGVLRYGSRCGPESRSVRQTLPPRLAFLLSLLSRFLTASVLLLQLLNQCPPSAWSTVKSWPSARFALVVY